jgi:hypothetical protein
LINQRLTENLVTQNPKLKVKLYLLYTILKTRLIIILTLIGFLTFAQENKLDVGKNKAYEIKAETLDSLYVKALNNRFDLILQSGWQYVEINEYGSRIKNLNVSDRYKFLTTDELIDLSIKEKRTIDVLMVVHNVISKDTVDINFGFIGYEGKRFNKVEITVACGGAKGYQPDIRFAFDSLSNEWRIIKNRFIKNYSE